MCACSACPPEVDDKALAFVFAKYGSIQQLVRERYPAESGFPIWSGVRGINMEVLQDIPSHVHVQGVKARVFYDGIQHKCFLCGSTEHLKAECPKRKSVNERLGTYAHPPVNRTGLIDAAASSSSGSVKLSVPIKAKGLQMSEEVEVAALAGAENQLNSDMGDESNGDSGASEEHENVDSEDARVVGEDGKDNQWQHVKRLRSRESNVGNAAKTAKVGDGQGPGLLKLQARRSRSLTPRQTATKGNGKEGITGDVNQFPPLGK